MFNKFFNIDVINKIISLPIVNDKDFLGLVSESDIYDLNIPEEPLGNHQLSLVRPYLHEGQHILEAMEMVSKLKLSLVPVLDARKHYLGVITTTELVHHFADFAALKNPGGIIVLVLNHNDYSLAQIAQIVEGNDAKILGTFLTSSSDTTQIELSLKLNVTDLTSIIQTFNRYNYSVLGSYMKQIGRAHV